MVRVVRTGYFKNLHKVVFGLSSVQHEIKFGGCHELFVGALDFLPDVVVLGHRSEAAQTMLLPLLSALSPPPLGASDGGIGGCGPATADSHTYVNQSEGGPDSLLTQGMSGCDVEQLLGGFWQLAAELVNQRVAHRTIPESRDDVGVAHTMELVIFL
jgi:hypothetical protein